MNKLINILYTPLDCPIQPDIDLVKFKSWISIYWQAAAERREHLKNIGKVGEDKVPNFPWNLTSVYTKKDKWAGEFNKKFPELSNYFFNAFDLNPDDVISILLLPVKEDHSGLGFWHQDHDEYALRMYLEFDDPDGKLFLKKTKVAYDTQPAISPRYFPKGQAVNIEDFLENERIECKIVNNKQCFFLNNVRAAHATWTSKPGVTRIAVIVYHTGSDEVMSKIEELVLRSTEKYKDYTIMWSN